MYNLIEYSDNYSDTSGSLWDFKRDGIDNNANVAYDNNALSFKYKAELIANTEAAGTKRRIKITVPLKYLSNFWRSLEMPLINCKAELSLRWTENCVLTTADSYDTDNEKERKYMFKSHNFKTIKCNPNDPGFDINKL